jgi:hypothetical protein
MVKLIILKLELIFMIDIIYDNVKFYFNEFIKYFYLMF